MKYAPQSSRSDLLGPPRPRGCARPTVELELPREGAEGGEAQLRIEGAFDALTVRDIKPAIEEVVASRPSRVTVDLDRVSLMDSTGVSAIVGLWKRIRAQGGSVVVVRAHDQPRAVLEVLRLAAVLGVS